MLTYLAGLCSSTLSVIFIIFIIGALGFMLGGINVKGISLGTAGVLIVALAYGILIHYFPEFSIEEKKITLWSNSISGMYVKPFFSAQSLSGYASYITIFIPIPERHSAITFPIFPVPMIPAVSPHKSRPVSPFNVKFPERYLL